MPNLPVPVITIGLLTLSNVFLTFAWYATLKNRRAGTVPSALASSFLGRFHLLREKLRIVSALIRKAGRCARTSALLLARAFVSP